MAFLDPVALLVFFGALAAAYGAGRLIRFIRRRLKKPEPPAPLSRAERRRRERDRR
jgi:hypothetical protein